MLSEALSALVRSQINGHPLQISAADMLINGDNQNLTVSRQGLPLACPLPK
ncbi:hypothetical protein WAE31_01985 (plasmid) [Xanthomonas axonopodis pv. vasculorum]